MALPNTPMVFDALDQLPASQLNDIVENVEALADGSGVNNDAISIIKIYNPIKFSAYLGANQTLALNTWTKLNINTENYDTNSNYDTTNAKYVAPISGYYHITGSANLSAQAAQNFIISLSVNSLTVESYRLVQIPNTTGNISIGSSIDIHLNAGDYICLLVYSGTVSKIINSGNLYTRFSGFLVSAT